MGDRQRLTTIERAYELARSGEVRGVMELERRLKAEQYEAVNENLHGSAMRRELSALCLASFNTRQQGS